MKISTIKNRFIVSQMRLDGSFHLSDGLEVRKIVSKSPYGTIEIKDVTSNIYCPGIFRRNYVKSGIPFLGGGDIQKQDLDSGKYLREKNTPNYEILQIKKGWSLVTCGGTIGDVVFANKLLAKCWVSQHVMRVIPQNIKEGMLYAYLASKYGKMLLTTNTYGSVIPTLNANNIADLPIPKFPDTFQQEVDDLIQESARLREEAADALEEAVSKFDYLFPTQFKEKHLGKVSSKEILNSINKRFEGGFHISEGKDIDKYIKEHYEWKSLGDVCSSISRPDIFKRYYVKNGITFLGGADIFLATPGSDKRLSRAKTNNIDALMIKEGMILLPRSGTIGNVAWAHAGHAQKLASEHVIRLLPNDILKAGYVYAFLASKYGKKLIQRYIFGSVIQHVEPPHLKLIPVPVIDDVTMNDIHNKVMIYSSSMGKAIEKERKAILMVEQEIEKWNKH